MYSGRSVQHVWQRPYGFTLLCGKKSLKELKEEQSFLTNHEERLEIKSPVLIYVLLHFKLLHGSKSRTKGEVCSYLQCP
jgi:hypothetical protein